MSRSYPIWNNVQACIYNSNKSWGAKKNCVVEVKTGSSASNSESLVTHETTHRRIWSEKEQKHYHIFKFKVNGLTLAINVFEDNNGVAGKFVKHVSKLSKLKSLDITL